MPDEYNHCAICGKAIPSDIIRCKACDKAWQAGYKRGYDDKNYEILRKLNEIFGG